MATLTPSPRMQFFDANGNPLAGGKLYTYIGGTTTPLATYTDSTGGTPNTNPIILDSRGEASVWLGDSLYYMELKTSTDTLIWSADNIGGIATANSVSRMAVTLTNIAALRATAVSTTYEAITKGYYTAGDGGHGEYYGVTGAAAGTYVDNGGTIIVPTGGNGSSAWKLKFNEINIKQFGAKGDGISNDYAQIQACLDYIHSVGGAIYIPNGNYLITSGVTFNCATAAKPLQIYGDGSASKLIMSGSVGFTAMSFNGAAGITRAFLTLKDFQIECSTTVASSAAIVLSGIADYQLHDIVIISPTATNLSEGIRLSGAQQGEISGGYIQSDTGLYLVTNTGAAGGIASNGCDLHGVSFNCSNCIITDYVDSFFAHANHLTGGNGIHVRNGGLGTLTIISNHMECSSVNSYALQVTNGGVCFIGNNCNGTGTQPAINLITCDQSVIANNLIAGNGITIAVTTTRLRLTNNWINGTITNASTSVSSIGNYGTGAATVDLPANITGNLLTVESTAATGDIVAFKGRPVTSANWGTTVSGTGELYHQFTNNAGAPLGAITASTGGAGLSIKSSPGGTLWQQVTSGATAAPSFVATAAAPIVGAGIAYGGTTQATATAGAAGAPPAQVHGYIIVNIGGVPRTIPYYGT